MDQDRCKWIALLRGVNVGGANRLPMEELRGLAAGLGWGDVRSYIASGNLVFDAPIMQDHAAFLTAAIEERFGAPIPVRVVQAKAFRAAVHRCPFEDQGNLIHGGFCWGGPVLDDALLASLKARDEDLRVDGDVVWVHAPSGVAKSKLFAKIEKVIGVRCTMRNLNTLNKLADMLA